MGGAGGCRGHAAAVRSWTSHEPCAAWDCPGFAAVWSVPLSAMTIRPMAGNRTRAPRNKHTIHLQGSVAFSVESSLAPVLVPKTLFLHSEKRGVVSTVLMVGSSSSDGGWSAGGRSAGEARVGVPPSCVVSRTAPSVSESELSAF